MKTKALHIIKTIEDAGFQALLVGGCVRDILMGKTPKDFDIATDCPMDRLEAMFTTHDIGANKDFGVVVVDLDGDSFEVAQFRSDGTYTDGRHPDKVQIGCSFREDSARRDFTVNAMGMTSDGRIIDFHCGQTDIAFGIISCVGDAYERFIEDELRIIRALRFAATLDFSLHPITADTIEFTVANGALQTKVAPERVKQELFKTAAHGGQSLARFLELAKDTGVLPVILPEIAAMVGSEHTLESHPEGDVFQHTLCALRACQSKDPLIVLATMFHDIGKPIIKHYAIMDDGTQRVRYTGHDQGKFFDATATRLKFSVDETEFVKFCIEKHMVVFDLHCMKKSCALEIIEHKFFWGLMEVLFADSFCTLAVGITTSPRVSKAFALNWEHACSIIENKEPERHVKIRKLINGKMIMDFLGICGGPVIGRLKASAIDMVIELDLDPEDPLTLNTVKEFISACHIAGPSLDV